MKKLILLLAAVVALAACHDTKGGEEVTSLPDAVLPAVVADGSQWTDGFNFYTAHRSGDTIVMEGCTLHEGGGLVRMLLTSDTTLQVLAITEWDLDDFSMFASPGSVVTHRRINGFELLVACDSTSLPTDVLQLYTGDMLDFVTDYIHHIWAGTYRMANGDTYLFSPEGKVQLPGSNEAVSYTLEKIYDMPSGCITVGDTHLAVQVVPDGIDVFKSEYSEDAEGWLAGDLIGTATAVESEGLGRAEWLSRCPMIAGVFDQMGAETALVISTSATSADTTNVPPIVKLNNLLVTAMYNKAAARDE